MGWRTSVSLSPKLGWKKQEDGGEAECLPPWDFAMKTGTLWDFPGGAVVKTPCSQCRGAQVQSLVRELNPTCMLQLRVHVPQLRNQRAATKELACLPQLRPGATK